MKISSSGFSIKKTIGIAAVLLLGIPFLIGLIYGLSGAPNPYEQEASSSRSIQSIESAKSTPPQIVSTTPDNNTNSEPQLLEVDVNREPQLTDAQKKFITIVQKAQRIAKESGDNRLKIGSAKVQRDNSLCQLFSSTRISNWVGKIDKLSSNSDGKGVLVIEIAPEIYIRTTNNSFSNAIHRTLIEPNTELYTSITALSKEQFVYFSGNFFNGNAEDNECFVEMSLTIRGKTLSPEFLFAFSNVAPYDGQKKQTNKSLSSVSDSLDNKTTKPSIEEAKQAEIEINKVWRMLSKEQRQALLPAQREFNAKKDIDCQKAYEKNGGGNAGTIAQNQCLIKRYRDRTAYLQNYVITSSESNKSISSIDKRCKDMVVTLVEVQLMELECKLGDSNSTALTLLIASKEKCQILNEKTINIAQQEAGPRFFQALSSMGHDAFCKEASAKYKDVQKQIAKMISIPY